MARTNMPAFQKFSAEAQIICNLADGRGGLVSNRKFYLFIVGIRIGGGLMLWIAIHLIDVYAIRLKAVARADGPRLSIRWPTFRCFLN